MLIGSLYVCWAVEKILILSSVLCNLGMAKLDTLLSTFSSCLCP
ncbi:hypothetical protein G5S_0939 [Chlamydia pecorum E58]|uniref:Uncharacterized protein n=1 Tax=Chlamydia pecorum (strain ATCC VR-628 / DSM 29919 / E58) TaxID=331635 RepID=A0AA34RDR7_CHLPE|nr:hypothetical protein G5S_0939 [Chlamydia pecorum E58]